MDTITYIFGAVAVVSLISFVGILTLLLKKGLLAKILFFFVSFAAGAMLAAAFFDIIPETAQIVPVGELMPAVVAGIVAFFFIERILHWHHFHAEESDVHPMVWLNLVGDGMHNFMDGIAIAVSFLVSVPTGLVTTIAVIAHEIPQEMGDFSVLVYGGLSTRKALFFNFLTALTAFLGALLALTFSSLSNTFKGQMAGFAAGGLIYIATVDLVPELHKEHQLKKILLQMAAFLAGLALIWFIIHTFE